MLVDIRSLRLRIGSTPILHDVNLRLAEGEIYGLLGPNGAGKSTTIAALLGLLPFRAAMLRVRHDPAAEREAIYARSGVLPEQSGFYDWMTADDYLVFFAKLHGRSPGRRDIAARLGRVGLAAGRRQTIGTFSRGMRQRLGLARALIGDPELLILDEPTNGLDPRGRREIHDLLLALSGENGVGILFCTHLLDDVERLCDRIGIIVGGRTVVEGPVAELRARNGGLARFRIGLSGPVPRRAGEASGVKIVGQDGDGCIVDLDGTLEPAAVWRELLFRGWPIEEIVHAGGGLEDVYLSLTERRAA